MSRYIKLADALRTLADTCYLDEIDENMQRLPSIDIVFCKECKWGKWCRSNGKFYLWCRPNIKRVKENDFCSCGKRRKL